MTRALSCLVDRLRPMLPTRKALAGNRWLRPFAHVVLRPELWRLHRRSVPRAIALGFFLGVLIPFAHSVVAALLAVVFRANVPVAIVSTWISNPVTWLVMWPLALRLGKMLLRLEGLQPAASAMPDVVARAEHGVLHHLSSLGLAALYGLLVEAVVLGAAGYLLAGIGWRWWVARRRRGRLTRALASRNCAA